MDYLIFQYHSQRGFLQLRPSCTTSRQTMLSFLHNLLFHLLILPLPVFSSSPTEDNPDKRQEGQGYQEAGNRDTVEVILIWCVQKHYNRAYVDHRQPFEFGHKFAGVYAFCLLVNSERSFLYLLLFVFCLSTDILLKAIELASSCYNYVQVAN